MAMAGVSNEGNGIGSLGQKIISSAKGLAGSTFSGLPGIEIGLRGRDSFGVGKAISVPSIRRGVTPTDFSDVVIRSSSSASSARDRSFRKAASGDADAVEKEFQNFLKQGRGLLSDENFLLFTAVRQQTVPTSTSDNITFRHRELGRQTRRGVYGQASSATDAELENPEPMWERHSQGEVVVQEDGKPEWRWRHEWRRLKKQNDAQAQDQQPKFQQLRECDLSRAMREGFEERQSVAVTRLNQIRGHLTIVDTTPSDLDSWKADWQTHLERCDWTVDREDDRLSPEPQQQQEPEKYYFHCPYRECHHRLLRQNENLSLAVRQRACVHDSCGYVSQTVDEWLKHVTGAHHGTQEGPSEHSSGRLEGDGRGMCQHGESDTEKYCELCSSLNKCRCDARPNVGDGGGVWITKKGSRLDIKAAPASGQEMRSMMIGDGQHENYERWSTEWRMEEWDSPS